MDTGFRLFFLLFFLRFSECRKILGKNEGVILAKAGIP